jgi:xanthine dehydrogenase accessory factor
MDRPADILKIATEWVSSGRTVCVATIIAKRGSGPRELGAKIAVASDGEIAGSIGGGAVEKKVLEEAGKVMEEARPAVLDFDLSGRSDDLDAMCGGNISVFLEPLRPAERLFVIGAGHVGVALAEVARLAGFGVTLVDDREEYLENPRVGLGIAKLCCGPEDIGRLGLGSNSFVVICTRGHKLDRDWLERVLPLGPRYVGMLGSKRKAAGIFESLEASGVARPVLERVRTPVGVEIGAVTPSEIAISITADLVRELRTPHGEAR